MSVRAQRVVSGVGRLEYATKAEDVRKKDHPLHAFYLNWLAKRGSVDSKRKAREFLAAFPEYREPVSV